MTGIVMVVIALASLGKLIDVDAFAASLATWQLVPKPLIAPLSVAVPMVEGLISGFWLLGQQRHRCELAAFFMLLAFSSIFLLHLALRVPPDCGCLGRKMAFIREGQEAIWVLGRNAVLLIMLAGGRVLTSSGEER